MTVREWYRQQRGEAWKHYLEFPVGEIDALAAFITRANSPRVGGTAPEMLNFLARQRCTRVVKICQQLDWHIRILRHKLN